jgi:hypothetical protein
MAPFGDAANGGPGFEAGIGLDVRDGGNGPSAKDGPRT